LYDAARIARERTALHRNVRPTGTGFPGPNVQECARRTIVRALLKYVRSSGNPAGVAANVTLSEDQLKQLKSLVPRHVKGASFFRTATIRIAPEGIQQARQRRDDWPRPVARRPPRPGPKRRPPKRAKVAVAVVEDDEDGE